jgi:hypothetical protein
MAAAQVLSTQQPIAASITFLVRKAAAAETQLRLAVAAVAAVRAHKAELRLTPPQAALVVKVTMLRRFVVRAQARHGTQVVAVAAVQARTARVVLAAAVRREQVQRIQVVAAVAMLARAQMAAQE